MNEKKAKAIRKLNYSQTKSNLLFLRVFLNFQLLLVNMFFFLAFSCFCFIMSAKSILEEHKEKVNYIFSIYWLLLRFNIQLRKFLLNYWFELQSFCSKLKNEKLKSKLSRKTWMSSVLNWNNAWVEVIQKETLLKVCL